MRTQRIGYMLRSYMEVTEVVNEDTTDRIYVEELHGGDRGCD